MADLGDELWDLLWDKWDKLRRAGKMDEADILLNKLDKLQDFETTPEHIRRDRLREVRRKTLEDDKNKLIDLENQLAEAKSREDDIKKELLEAEELYHSIRARRDRTKERQTSEGDDANQDRIDVERLSDELNKQSHHIDELLEKTSMKKKRLDEEKEKAERQDRNLRNYLKASIVDDKLITLLRSAGIASIDRKLKGVEITSSTTFSDLFSVLKSHGIIEIGNYTNLSRLLIVAFDRFECRHLIDEIGRVEDRILDQYDIRDELCLSDFERKEELGGGGFGKVYAYQNIRDDTKRIAVKEIPFPKSDESKEKAALLTEVKIMHELSKYGHPNIIKYFFDDLGVDKLCIGMEYMEGGSVARKINGQPLSDCDLRSYTFQILNGVRFLHDKHIVHRDIKPDNILLDSEKCIKLADFGISKELNTFLLTHGATTAGAGTCQYMSPEAVKGNYDDPQKNEDGEGNNTKTPEAVKGDDDELKKQGDEGYGSKTQEAVKDDDQHSKKKEDEGYGSKSKKSKSVKGDDDFPKIKGYGIKTDIWSVGCVVLEMATGKRPWSGFRNPMTVMFRIGSGGIPPVDDSVPDDVKDFLEKTFIVKPADRSSAEDLLKHKLLADLEERYLKNMETLDEGETASSSSDYMQLPKRHRSGSDTSDVIAKKKKVSESP